MNSKLNAIRALAAYNAQRSLSLFTAIFTAVITVLVVSTVALAYFFSPWWLIVMLPIALFLLAFLVIRKIVDKIISRIHRHPFTKRQREQLEKFTGGLKNLAEIKNTPVFIYAIITIWDVLRRRDETTIQQIINSSKCLKADFAELEKHFGER